MLKIDAHARYLPRTWPNLSEEFGDARFPVIPHEDGRARIYKDGMFFREVWSESWNPAERVAEHVRFGARSRYIDGA